MQQLDTIWMCDSRFKWICRSASTWNIRQSLKYVRVIDLMSINVMDQLESEPDPNSFYHRRKILTSALALTALCAQLTTLMAASSQEAKKENVSWNEWETRELVQFLWEHRAQSGDGVISSLQPTMLQLSILLLISLQGLQRLQRMWRQSGQLWVARYLPTDHYW